MDSAFTARPEAVGPRFPFGTPWPRVHAGNGPRNAAKMNPSPGNDTRRDLAKSKPVRVRNGRSTESAAVSIFIYFLLRCSLLASPIVRILQATFKKLMVHRFGPVWMRGRVHE